MDKCNKFPALVNNKYILKVHKRKLIWVAYSYVYFLNFQCKAKKLTKIDPMDSLPQPKPSKEQTCRYTCQ